MRLYKLTNGNAKTYGGMQWGEGITNTVPKTSHPVLCTGSVIHACLSLEIGLLLNSGHANFADDNLRAFEAEGDIMVENWDKVGVFSLTTLREITIPEWYIDHKKRLQVIIAFARLCTDAMPRQLHYANICIENTILTNYIPYIIINTARFISVTANLGYPIDSVALAREAVKRVEDIP